MRVCLLKGACFAALSCILLFFSCEAQQLMLDEDAYDSTLTLYANYGANETSVQRFAADYPFVLKDNPFIRPGYAFVGWTDKPDSSLLLYGDKANILLKADAVLYALWELDTYMVHYVTNGGKRTIVYPEQFTVHTSVPLNDVKNGKYYFGGWYEQADFSGEAISEIPEGSVGDKTVYARWCGQITYHLNGGAFAGEDALDENVGYYTIHQENELPVPALTGKSFAGWHFAEDLSDAEFSVLPEKNALALAVYASWIEPEYYTITYVLNGGMNAEENPVVYDNALVAVPLYEPVYTGFVFVGWHKDKDFSDDALFSIPADATGDIVLYAAWENSEVSVDGDTDIDAVYDDGTDAAAFADEELLDAAEEDVEDIADDSELPTTYTVSFDAGDVSVSLEAITADEESSVLLPVITDEEETYYFVGWATEPKTRTVTYLAGQEVCFEEDVTLYAVWTKQKLTLIPQREPDDATVSASAENVYYSLNDLAATVENFAEKESETYYTLQIAHLESYVSSADEVSLGAIVRDCDAITEIEIIDDTLTAIPDAFFADCQYIERVLLPPSVVRIGNEAFAGCVALQDIDLTAITQIGEDAFKGCAEVIQEAALRIY